jgi:type II secretory pathway pseudopilin PulG
MASIQSKLVTAAAVGAAAVGGAAVANAASSTTASPTASATPAAATRGPAGGRHTFNGKTEKALTGDVESKVRAAALAKVSGTVERVETNVDSSAPYEAHITTADGTEVEVQVNTDYTVAAVNAMGGHH